MGTQKIITRSPESIYQAEGEIEGGTFKGRWHFSFDNYHDKEYSHFGTLRVFNDETLSPGAVWPLHPHSNVEIVTYCAGGELRHADKDGPDGVLKKGWVQHMTIGKGMWHSEINNLPNRPTRFIQMWFVPFEPDLEPAVQQKPVERSQRTNIFLPLAGNESHGALPIASDAKVIASFLMKGHSLKQGLGTGRGAYLYVLEGGPVLLKDAVLEQLAASKVIGGSSFTLAAENDAELLLVEVPLAVKNRS